MQNYVSVTEYGQLHGLTTGYIRRLISNGRIPAVKIGTQWAIPADTPRPEDMRVKSGQYKNWRKPKNEESQIPAP